MELNFLLRVQWTLLVVRGLRKYLEVTPGKYLIESLQKTAVFGTPHTMWKVLQSGT
jgi:hypothetical protein